MCACATSVALAVERKRTGDCADDGGVGSEAREAKLRRVRHSCCNDFANGLSMRLKRPAHASIEDYALGVEDRGKVDDRHRDVVDQLGEHDERNRIAAGGSFEYALGGHTRRV
jgi:hypothetical protein